MKQKINHLAIVLIVILEQVISASWYGLFANPWMNYVNKTIDDFTSNPSPLPYIIAVLNAIVLNYMLAWLFIKLSVDSTIKGLGMAIVLWISFIFLPEFTQDSFSLVPFGLTLINTGNFLVYFVVSGLVLGGWKKNRL